ncbi:MAG: S8 family serine peptidase [Candidatus Levybacteria bacterium]|nr:S8 family serine peptidase [Candidatus Levybacteria bacterium]
MAYEVIEPKMKLNLRKLINIITLVLIVAAIPFTVFLSQQRQDIRQRASEKNQEQLKEEPKYAPNEILIKVKKQAKGKIKEKDFDDPGIGTLKETFKKHKPKKFEKIVKESKKSNVEADIFSWYRLVLEDDNAKDPSKVKGIIASLLKDPDIETAEPNFIVKTTAVPNDPYYSSTGSWGQSYPDLWGLKKINMEGAWDQSTGSSTIIVAGIDTGVDRNHEDIKDNMWVNTAETPNNGVDDDGNGYMDDYYGWDFANNDNDPMDDHGHGTHTAGTIAAVGNNNLGVVGINWVSKIMTVKFLDAGGSGTLDNGAKALLYAVDMGTKVSSNSWGCRCQSVIIDDAINYAHSKGAVTVVAAGNSDLDALDYSPASSDYAITVAASDPNDLKASFSNWGEKIDVTAPGVDILSVRAAVNPMCTAERTVGTNYCRVSGTSMATPHVAGLAALLLAKDPTLTNEEIRQLLRLGATDLGSSGKDKDFGFGRIEANNSLSFSSTKPLAPVITSPTSRTGAGGSSLQVIGMASGTNFSRYKVEVGSGRSPTTWTTVKESTTQAVNGILATVNPEVQLADGKNIIRLTVFDTIGKSYQFQVNDIYMGNFNLEYGQIASPQSFAAKGVINIQGNAKVATGLTFSKYIIEWKEGIAPETPWSTAGITLANGGTVSVYRNVLGTWDTTLLDPAKTYSLRIKVYSVEKGLYAQNTIKLAVDPNLVLGWPRPIYVPGLSSGYDPIKNAILSDLDGDGAKEVVILTKDTINTIDYPLKIYVFRENGSIFPLWITGNTRADSYNLDDITIEDIDNDGKKELIVTGDSLGSCGSSDEKYIFIYRTDNGTSYPGWPKRYPGWVSDSVTPNVIDIDLDGKKELVFIDGWGYLHEVKPDGTELAGFPKRVITDYAYSNCNSIFTGGLITSDINQDGKPEIIIENTNIIYVFDNQGNLLPGWPADYCGLAVSERYKCNKSYYTYLALGDIDGDGNKEVVARLLNVNTNSLYLHSVKYNGTSLPGWPQLLQNNNDTWWYHTGNPSSGDTDSDGKDEVIIYNYGTKVYGLNGIKYRFDNNPVDPDDLHGHIAHDSFALADLDRDGEIEIGGRSSKDYFIIKDIKSNPRYLWQRDFSPYDTEELRGIWVPFISADMSADGTYEVLGIQSPSSGDSFAITYLWRIPPSGTENNNYDWPMFKHDPARTGRLSTSVLLTPVPTTIPTNTPIPTVFPTAVPTSTPTPSPINTPTPTVSDPAPTVTITYPLDGARIRRRTTIKITASASDNIGVKKVEFYVNGSLKCTDGAAPYTCSYKLGSGVGIVYIIQAKAYDFLDQITTYAVQIVSTK